MNIQLHDLCKNVVCFRNNGTDQGSVSLVRLSPIHKTGKYGQIPFRNIGYVFGLLAFRRLLYRCFYDSFLSYHLFRCVLFLLAVFFDISINFCPFLFASIRISHFLPLLLFTITKDTGKTSQVFPIM